MILLVNMETGEVTRITCSTLPQAAPEKRRFASVSTAKSVSCHYIRYPFLARHIRISGILACVRNSYLIHVILPRLSREDCSLVVLELTHGHQVLSMFSQNDVIM